MDRIAGMTPAEFKAARHAMGMSISDLADWLGYEGPNAADSIRQMEKGAKPISGPVSRAMRMGLRLADSGRASEIWP
jgi:DNA-binding transcriptional regulator YiaG